jgi:hypothetical protein
VIDRLAEVETRHFFVFQVNDKARDYQVLPSNTLKEKG